MSLNSILINVCSSVQEIATFSRFFAKSETAIKQGDAALEQYSRATIETGRERESLHQLYERHSEQMHVHACSGRTCALTQVRFSTFSMA